MGKNLYKINFEYSKQLGCRKIKSSFLSFIEFKIEISIHFFFVKIQVQLQRRFCPIVQWGIGGQRHLNSNVSTCWSTSRSIFNDNFLCWTLTFLLRSVNFESKFSCPHLNQKTSKIIFLISASKNGSNQENIWY